MAGTIPDRELATRRQTPRAGGGLALRAASNYSVAWPRGDLTAAQRDLMFALLCRHFAGVTRDQFENDLAEKNWAILVWQNARLVGFSTLLAYESSFDGEPVSVIYSGDTIMAQEAWGSPSLARAWITTVNELRATYSRGPYYWLLLTSGFRTYRFLPVFWRMFWPRFDAEPDAARRQLITRMSRERFGNQFDEFTGLVRFPRPQKLIASLAAIPPGRLADPHVAHFLSRNPHHAEGDELVCLTDLSAENLTAAGRRMLRHEGHEVSAGPR